jgi:alpha-amylase
VRLTPSNYPSWSGGVDLPPGPVQFKFVKIDGAGRVIWENGPNHTVDTSQSNTFTSAWR